MGRFLNARDGLYLLCHSNRSEPGVGPSPLLAHSPCLGMSGDTTAMRATTGDGHDHRRAVRHSRQSRTPPAHLARSWLLRFLITSVVRWRRAGTG